MNATTAPEELKTLMQNAEEYVKNYFAQLKTDPAQGTIEIADERYILVRAASMSVDFFETIKQLYQSQGEEQARNIAWQLLFDLAHALGKQDAKKFHLKRPSQLPSEQLATGPALFSYLGWAHVKILPESNLTAGDDFVLVYDHTYSFEADAWLRENKTSELPVCIMNAGYSSGWTSTTYNTPLIATEIMCRAKGDHACRFIMAPPETIEQHINNYLKQKPKLIPEVTKYEIPDFFLRKRLEEELRKSEEKYRIQFEEAIDATFMAESDTGIIIDCNQAAEKLIEYKKDEIIGKHQSFLHPPQPLFNGTTKNFNNDSRFAENFKIMLPDTVITKSGTVKYVEITAHTITTRDKIIITGIFRDVTAKKTAELEIERRIKVEKTVNSIAKTMSQISLCDINDHITTALGTMGKTLNFDRAYVFMFSPNKEHVSNTHEWCAPNIEPQINNLQNCIAADFKNFIHAINSEELLEVKNVADLPDDWENEKQLFECQNIKSLIAMPIRYRGTLVGFSGFDVVNSTPSWTSNDTATLNTFNEILATTLERQRFEERLDYATNYDPLTKLPNRLKFETTAEEALINSQSSNKNFALLYIDIDNFKEINTTHGHYTGDILLQKVAHRLKNIISNKNFVGRLSSDKFIAIANNLNNQNEAAIIAQNILDHIKPAFQINNEPLKMTTSIGIAYYPKDGDNISSLLKLADKAMYNAKREGRNNFKFSNN